MVNTFGNVTKMVTTISKVVKSMPKTFRVISIVAACVTLAAFVLGLTSCGVTRATVSNKATGTTTEIKITTSNPTSVTTSPNVSLPLSYGKTNETAQGD